MIEARDRVDGRNIFTNSSFEIDINGKASAKHVSQNQLQFRFSLRQELTLTCTQVA
jgi:hypothetical protein